MTDQVLLRSDVHLCVTEGYGVALDLANDKYSAIIFPPDAARSAPSSADAGRLPPEALAAKFDAQREALMEGGLLTTDPALGRPIAVTDGPHFDAHIFGLDDQRAFGLAGEAAAGLKISARDVAEFFFASWKASTDLKTRHISRVVADVKRRKGRASARTIDLDELRRLTAIFRRLRPWYPRKYLCLYDSLALIEFLALRRLYPVWVFAVQAQPFGAHCWVQSDQLLLNEGTEYAGQFTPIMAV